MKSLVMILTIMTSSWVRAQSCSSARYMCSVNGEYNILKAEYPVTFIDTGSYEPYEKNAYVFWFRGSYDTTLIPMIYKGKTGDAIFQNSHTKIDFRCQERSVVISRAEGSLALKCVPNNSAH